MSHWLGFRCKIKNKKTLKKIKGKDILFVYSTALWRISATWLSDDIVTYRGEQVCMTMRSKNSNLLHRDMG